MTKQIGSQTDVPDAGDPIISPWYQDTANKIVHTFATAAARDAQWPTPPNGALCVTLDNNILWQRRSGAWGAASPGVAPRVLALVRTQVSVNPFTLPTDPVARLYLIAWSWWSYGNSANGTMTVSVREQGGPVIGSYAIPFAASAAPVPTLSSVSYFQYTQPAGVAARVLEAVISGGTAGWSADGYINAIGYA